MFLPVIFGFLSFLGMETLVLRPFWYVYGAAFFLILAAISAALEQKNLILKDFFRAAAIFSLFFISTVAVVFYFENPVSRQILIIASSLAYGIRLAKTDVADKKIIINFLFIIFFAFLFSAALFGLDLFFAVPAVYLSGAAFILGLLAISELAGTLSVSKSLLNVAGTPSVPMATQSVAAGTGDANPALGVFGAIFLSELFFAMTMLPNYFYLGAAASAIYIFLFGEIFYVRHFAPRAEIKLSAFSLILLLTLFLTAKWI